MIEAPPISRRYRLISALAALFLLVLFDLVLTFICGRIALLTYLVVGGLGIWIGGKLHPWILGAPALARFTRYFLITLACVTVLGMTLLTFMPTNWDLRCAWRQCGRALSPGLFVSPYPLDTPSCQAWFRCVNEYPYSRWEYSRALDRIEEQGCPPP